MEDTITINNKKYKFDYLNDTIEVVDKIGYINGVKATEIIEK